MKRIGIYGTTGAGKTTLVNAFKEFYVDCQSGSESEGIKDFHEGDLNTFLQLNEEERQEARQCALTAYFEKFASSPLISVIDAHYSFWVENKLCRVMPQASELFYTTFVYLNPGIKEIQRRQKLKFGRNLVNNFDLRNWIDFELKGLTEVCELKNTQLLEIGNLSLSESVAELCRITRENRQ